MNALKNIKMKYIILMITENSFPPPLSNVKQILLVLCLSIKFKFSVSVQEKKKELEKEIWHNTKIKYLCEHLRKII